MSPPSANAWTRRSRVFPARSPRHRPSFPTRASLRAPRLRWWSRKRNGWMTSARHWYSCRHSARSWDKTNAGWARFWARPAPTGYQDRRHHEVNMLHELLVEAIAYIVPVTELLG